MAPEGVRREGVARVEVRSDWLKDCTVAVLEAGAMFKRASSPTSSLS